MLHRHRTFLDRKQTKKINPFLIAGEPSSAVRMAGIIVIFDFDRTIIDSDSDNWVVTEMGLTPLFKELRSSMPWNSLMVISTFYLTESSFSILTF